jgi:hypothetical protein
MKLFCRGSGAGKPADATPAPAQHVPYQKPLEISLSDEQKRLLEKPVDPRVGRILEEIYADKAAAELALKSRRIIDFPHDDSGERHVIQDKEGFWRIVPGAPPPSLNEFFDAI